MNLTKFINIVEDLERQQFGEGIFWETRAKLGHDFLCKPLELENISTHYHEFLSKWASYRHKIDWQKLVDLWGSKQQLSATGLVHSSIEDASDAELSEAASLFNYLWDSSISGLGTTNISKLLALGLPSICMMWDQGIMNEFKSKILSRPGSRNNILTEYHRFLLHRRLELQDLIGQVQAANNQSREQAIVWLKKLPRRVNSWNREKPLAKLMDEYYYWNPRKS